jgi:hypothetical protein
LPHLTCFVSIHVSHFTSSIFFCFCSRTSITLFLSCLFSAYFLAYFAYFEKNKSKFMRSPCCLCSPPINFGCLHQSIRNLVYISWHLSPSQRRTS